MAPLFIKIVVPMLKAAKCEQASTTQLSSAPHEKDTAVPISAIVTPLDPQTLWYYSTAVTLHHTTLKSC